MAHEHPPLNQSIYLPYWHFSILYTYILQEKSHFNACIPCIYKITVKSLLTLKQKHLANSQKQKNTVILYALFTKDMSSEPLKIDIEKVVKEKAPKYAKKIPGFLFRYLERTIHQDEINYILKTYKDSTGVKFADDLLSYMNVHINVIGKENIPPEGRFIFASNHPLGALDGVALIRFFGHFYSGKIKFLVNDLLMHIKPLAPVFLPINKYGSQAKESSLQINNAYESDEQMLIFPAGLCSRLQHGKIKDLEWKKTFIAKAVQSQRDIIPIYFEGRNSTFFYRFAQIRKCIGLKFNIELIYLPDEMFNSKNKTFDIYIGKPIPWQTFDKSKSLQEWAQIVKEKVYQIKKNQ